MTFADFKRMKPKYKLRLLAVILVALALFIGILYAISFGFSALRTQLSTTKIDGVTAGNVLTKPAMNEILTIMKQEDSANILVLDSAVTMNETGGVTGVGMNFVNFKDKGTAEYWQLYADGKKAWLRKNETKYENLSNALRMRKVEFKSYYPALSRIISPNLLSYLSEKAPVGASGSYTFTDNFGDNLNPDYTAKIDGGLVGLWVSKIGSVNEIQDNFIPPADCAPTIVSVSAVKTEKGLFGSRRVLQDPEDKYVVLLEVGPF